MAIETFTRVWFLPDENRWRDGNFLAFRAIGTLTVERDRLEFQTKTEKVIIAAVKRVTFGKQGRDWVNNWVKVEYGNDTAISTAFFADGSWLGWGGIFGGTRRILTAVERLPDRR